MRFDPGAPVPATVLLTASSAMPVVGMVAVLQLSTALAASAQAVFAMLPTPAGSGFAITTENCVLAEPPGAVVHQGGDPGKVGPAPGVGQLRHPFGPGAFRLGYQLVGVRPDTGVQDGGDVPCPGQVAGGDRGADDFGRVQPGQLGGVQGAEQPPGLVG